MKQKTRLALSFLALAGIAGGLASTAMADDGRKGNRGDSAMRFERADADSSGDVSFEEFSAVVGSRLANADADGDGSMTVSEIATEIQRMRAERMARRIVERFDTDGDGILTKAEVESRHQKMFALLDRNDDGKIVKEEMPRHGFRMRGMGHHRN